MKSLKYISVIVISFGLITYLGWLWIQNNIHENLIGREKLANYHWMKFQNELSDRNKYLNRINYANSDSLKFYISRSKILIKDDKNSKSSIYNEFDVNRYMTKFDSLSEMKPIFMKLNLAKTSYNQSARAYNLYRGQLPNLFIAHKYNFINMKLFILNYGFENRDPKVEDIEFQKWADSVNF